MEGTILKMEFLHPPRGDPCQVTLLLVLFSKGRAKFVWYEWSSRTTLRESSMLAIAHVLPREEYSPLLLIPLMMGAAFMLVCEERMTVYKDILTGNPAKYIQSLENIKAPQEPGISKRFPLWTQWARPVRCKVHREDAIYLCREDGIIQYLEFRNDFDNVIDSTHQAGRLGINVNTAFAVLDIGPNTMDLLVAGGDTSPGGLWRVWARQDPKLLNSMANWSPLRCLAVTHDSPVYVRGGSGKALGGSPAFQRLFACTGKGKHSAVSELRYGYSASEIFSTEITGDLTQNGVLGIWAFHGFFGDPKYQFEGPDSRSDGTYVLLSHPIQTSLIHIQSRPMTLTEKDAELNGDTEFTVEVMELGLPNRTIAAGTTAKGVLILITETAILVSSISIQKFKEEDSNDVDMTHEGASFQQLSVVSSFELPTDARILAAGFHHADDKSVIVLAVQVNDCFSLVLGHLETEYEPRGEPFQLLSQPSCVQLQRIGSKLIVFAATIDCKLYIFQIDGQGLMSSLTLPYEFGGSFAICDSIAIINFSGDLANKPRYLLVCGLRNGSVQTLHYEEDALSTRLAFCEKLVIGNTSVSVVTDVTRQGRAFVHCERSFCVLEYPQDICFEAPARVHGTWIIDRDRPALQQGTLSAFTQVVDSWLPRGALGLTFGFLVCLDASRLRIVKIDDDQKPHMVPRKLMLQGGPEKMIHSEYFNKFIVLGDTLSVLTAKLLSRNPNVFGMRKLQPFITFLDPDIDWNTRPDPTSIHLKHEDCLGEANKMLPLECKPTERCIGITEWFPKMEGKEHHMLIVSTKSIPGSKPAGRLLLYSLPREASQNPRIELKKSISLEAPVYSVATHCNQKSIVYCSGNEICVLSIKPGPSGMKFQPPVKLEMRSPGRRLTLREPYFYVSSTRESLSVFEYADEKLVYRFGDQVTRDGLDHIVLPEKNLVLASDVTGSVVGLWQPHERRADYALTTIFEAILPSSINSFQRVDRPVWYRDPDNPRGNQAIIGSSEDGRVTQFEILSKGWRLLRFIQNMAERNPLVCPFKDQGPFKRHIDPATTKPHYMHINGDILQRILNHGAVELIKNMLDVEPDAESLTDFESVEARWEKFKELASEVVDVEEANYLAKVVRWTRYQMRSAL